MIEQLYRDANFIQSSLESPYSRNNIGEQYSSIVGMIEALQHSYRVVSDSTYMRICSKELMEILGFIMVPLVLLFLFFFIVVMLGGILFK